MAQKKQKIVGTTISGMQVGSGENANKEMGDENKPVEATPDDIGASQSQIASANNDAKIDANKNNQSTKPKRQPSRKRNANGAKAIADETSSEKDASPKRTPTKQTTAKNSSPSLFPDLDTKEDNISSLDNDKTENNSEETTDIKNETNKQNETNEQIEQPQGQDNHVGAQLANARLAAGLSVTELSDILKISQQHIINLEAGNYQFLPNRPFAIGYVKSIAKHFDLDVAFLTMRFGEEISLLQNKKDEHHFPEPIAGNQFPSWIVLLISIALVVAIFFAWQKYSKVELIEEEAASLPLYLASDLPPQEDEVNITPAPPESVVDETPLASHSVIENPPPQEKILQEEILTETEENQTEIAEEQTVPALQSQNYILRAVDHSWLRLIDKENRQTIFEGILHAPEIIAIDEDMTISYNDGTKLELSLEGDDDIILLEDTQQAIGIDRSIADFIKAYKAKYESS